MERQLQIEYFNKLWHNMREALSRYELNEAEEALREFRVAVKKLRAFFVLAGIGHSEDQFQQEFKPVRDLFKKAGGVRTATLNSRLAQKLSASAELIFEQYRLYRDATRHFDSALKDLKNLNRLKEKLHSQTGRLDDQDINQFYRNRLMNVNAAFADLHFDERLHENRKQLKILLYNYTLVAPLLDVKLNKAYLKQVQTAIGNWHDNAVAQTIFQNEPGILPGLRFEAHELAQQVNAVVNDFFARAISA